ncbi:hypothetical protein [Xanthobacter autotrophicus]|uniref:hypothetical protein n=1 Tax=Xanthobacter autotrophicus TaxID=280 RepID=UPI0037265FD4
MHRKLIGQSVLVFKREGTATIAPRKPAGRKTETPQDRNATKSITAHNQAGRAESHAAFIKQQNQMTWWMVELVDPLTWWIRTRPHDAGHAG